MRYMKRVKTPTKQSAGAVLHARFTRSSSSQTKKAQFVSSPLKISHQICSRCEQEATIGFAEIPMAAAYRNLYLSNAAVEPQVDCPPPTATSIVSYVTVLRRSSELWEEK
ncbi:hypothetical protein F1880_007030 [Penicillium rolfsii]|nr:hypothetical protein F1880_007030 [Penicillium rolfsii]